MKSSDSRASVQSDLLQQLGLIRVQLELRADFLCKHAHTHQLVPLLLFDPCFLRQHLLREFALLGPQLLYTLSHCLFQFLHLGSKRILLPLQLIYFIRVDGATVVAIDCLVVEIVFTFHVVDGGAGPVRRALISLIVQPGYGISVGNNPYMVIFKCTESLVALALRRDYYDLSSFFLLMQ